MLIARRLLYNFKKSIPQLPHAITTIYKPDLEGYVPPNSRCLLPAVTMAGVSVLTQLSPTNIWLTAGLAGLGWLYYCSRTIQHSLLVKQIDASHDFSKLYIHFNGGWYEKWLFLGLPEDIIYDKSTKILQISNSRVEVGSEMLSKQINLQEIYLKLKLDDTFGLPFPVGPLNFQKNLVKGFKNQVRQFCEVHHSSNII